MSVRRNRKPCAARTRLNKRHCRAGSSTQRWGLYILRCADGTLYTGITNNLDGRLKRHRAGKGAKYTRGRLPVRLAYMEQCADRAGAMKRERAVKKLTRREKLKLALGRAVPTRNGR